VFALCLCLRHKRGVPNGTAQNALLPTNPKRGFTMATKTKTAAAPTKATAAAPTKATSVNSGAALLLQAPTVTALCALPVQQPPAVVLAAAMALPPRGALYLPNMAHKGCAAFGSSLRGYAWANALLLAKAMPKGFALNQLQYAICGCILPAGHQHQQFTTWGASHLPSQGWPSHNMHKWGAGPTRAWWVPVT